MERLAALAQKNRAELLAVGLPRNMDGSEGESAKNAREIGALLEEAAGLRWPLWTSGAPLSQPTAT